jgi:hypothetical protein
MEEVGLRNYSRNTFGKNAEDEYINFNFVSE